MKTVIDAVNELKGDLKNTHEYGCEQYLSFCHWTGVWVTTDTNELTETHWEVCTNKEFLATVAECETNFGKCNINTVSAYLIALCNGDTTELEPTKDLDKELDVDIWKNAPEGATHLSMGSENFPAYYYKLASDGLMLSNEYTNGWVHSCNANSWLNNNDSLITRPQTTTIFTQEMANNGVLPSVGMSVVVRYNHDSKTATHTGRLKYLSDNIVILDINGSEWHGLLGDYVIEHIDTRTDKEKAIDKYIVKQVSLLTCNEAGMIRDAFEAGVAFQQLI
tara:strand:+ start:7 stop:840 length:834 start_codon:yes stop_codon:yes gene_type:complete